MQPMVSEEKKSIGDASMGQSRSTFSSARPCCGLAPWNGPLRTLVVAVLMAATAAHGESLLEAYQLAHENDSKFRAAQAEARANGTAIDQARAGYLPTARFEVDTLHSRQRINRSNNPIFGAGVTTFPTFSQTLSITQPIFRRDVIVRYRQAKAVVRQAGYTILAAEQDLLLRTTAAYLSVLAAQDSVALARAEREAVGKALDLAVERLRSGLGTITNQHDAKARHAVAQAREIESLSKLADARQGLLEITGRPLAALQSLRSEFPLARPDPSSVDAWVGTALQQNLSLQARDVAIEIAQQEVKRQRAGYYPSLNLLVSHNRRDAGSTLFGGGSDVTTTDVTLRLTVPLYEGGLTSAITKEAAHRLEKSREELEQERRAVERATRASYDGVISGIGLVEALKQSVVSQESALEAKDTGYKAGRFTLLAVLDAQRDLFLAKRDLAQSRYDYLLNLLKLKQAAGILAEGDLGAVQDALQ